MVAGDPGYGGAAWAVMQYVLGLQELGWDVWLVEPVDDLTAARTQFFAAVVARFDLGGRSALLKVGTEETVGADYAQLVAAAARADVLLNVSGMLADPRLLERIPNRVYLDLDPAFNQLWHAQGAADMRFEAHTAFATGGLRIGQPGCSVPTCGIDWIPTLPPVVLSHWPVADPAPHAAFTTVGNWRSYGSIEYDGVQYGQKAHAFRDLFALPARTSQRFEVALSISADETADIEALATNRWQLADPGRAAGTPDRYEDFIRRSKAEIGIAKAGYARSRCGWFSDRSAAYLASGRPVVAQDTGAGDAVPVGEGLLTFTTLDEAVEAIERVDRDYVRHCAAARAFAEDQLASARVLGSLLEQVVDGRHA